VRIPVATDSSFRVERVEEGESRHVQFARSVAAHSSFRVIQSNADHVLIFDTGVLPPVGAVAFRIVKEPDGRNNDHRVSSSPSSSIQRREQKNRDGTVFLELSNGLVSARFDSQTGMLMGLSSGNSTLPVHQMWGYYTSFDRDIDKSNITTQNSGAYIFRPSTPDQDLRPLTPKKDGGTVLSTPVGVEVHVSFEETWIQQVTRVTNGVHFVEIEYTVGPVPINDGRGKEIVTRLSSPIKSQGIVYTDSNGREFQKRKRDFRPTWDIEVFEPVAGNYYPVNAAIYLEDDTASLAVVVDRSQGGASLLDGSVELMVQRRIVADDDRGVTEPLNETVGGVSPYPPYGNNERVGEGVIVRGKHRLLVGGGSSGARLARSEMDAAFAEPLIFVGSAPVTASVSFETALFSGLTNALPENIMLITFMRMANRYEHSYLLRLGHQYASGEDDSLSEPIDVNLPSLFVGHTITAVTEMTLTGNQGVKDRAQRRIKWAESSTRVDDVNFMEEPLRIFPMEIRTFEIAVAPPSR
jgi:Glycosyl hydrolases family 38 C-terminal domain